ncbi:MAG: hypothetical protein U0Q15_04300 [Kineosporiaceae bacterium]
MTALVGVFRRQGRFLLQTMDRTTDKLWITSGGQHVGEGLGAATLGAAVRAGLGQTTLGVPHPKTWPTGKAAEGPLPGVADVRSWKEFASCAASVTVHEGDDGRVSIMPAKRDKRGRLYEPMIEHEVVLPGPLGSVADEAIGAAVLEALAASDDDAG